MPSMPRNQLVRNTNHWLLLVPSFTVHILNGDIEVDAYTETVDPHSALR